MANALLILSAECGDAAECVRLVVEHGANVCHTTAAGSTALHKAAQGGHVECCEQLIRLGAEINAREDATVGGSTPLHLAVSDNHFDVCAALIASGDCDPDTRDTMLGFTPLHLAAKHERLPIAKLLLANGADPHLTDFGGQNPSFWAFQTSSSSPFLDIPGIPPPRAPLVEEEAAAFARGQAQTLAGSSKGAFTVLPRKFKTVAAPTGKKKKAGAKRK